MTAIQDPTREQALPALPIPGSPTPPSPSPGSPTRHRLVLGAMLISTFMAAVEVTVISTAMPTIVARLGGFALFSWAFGIYLLTQAVMTPVYGKLADLYGRKVVYLGSTALFLLGSLLCGLAWSMTSLIAFRAIQGLGGGGLTPLGTIIISDISPPAERPRLLGYVSGVWGIAAIVGPLLGAFFVGSLGWSFVFWVNLPIGLLTMTLVAKCLTEPSRERRGRIDLLSSALLMAGIGAVMVALVQYEMLNAAAVAALIAVGALALAALAWHERRAAEPMLPAHLWRRPLILAADASALLCGALMIGITAFLPTYVQGVAGASALVAGFTLGIMTVSWTVASMGLGRFMTRLRYRSLAVAGSVILVAGSVGLLGAIGGLGTAAGLDIACVLIGAGLGLNSIVFTVAIQSAVAWQDRGQATSLFYFARLLGQALGAAAFGGVLNAGVLRAGLGGRDVVRDLVEPARRARLPVAELHHLVGVLDGALHNVFLLAAGVAAAALVVAALVPGRLGLGVPAKIE